MSSVNHSDRYNSRLIFYSDGLTFYTGRRTFYTSHRTLECSQFISESIRLTRIVRQARKRVGARGNIGRKKDSSQY